MHPPPPFRIPRTGTYKNMLGSPGAPTMFTAVVVRMPNDDDEVLAKFQKFDTSQQQQYVDLNQAARQESEGGGGVLCCPLRYTCCVPCGLAPSS